MKKGRWGGTALTLSLRHLLGICARACSCRPVSRAHMWLGNRPTFSVFGLMQRMKNGLEVLSVAIREWRES